MFLVLHASMAFADKQASGTKPFVPYQALVSLLDCSPLYRPPAPLLHPSMELFSLGPECLWVSQHAPYPLPTLKCSGTRGGLKWEGLFLQMLWAGEHVADSACPFCAGHGSLPGGTWADFTRRILCSGRAQGFGCPCSLSLFSHGMLQLVRLGVFCMNGLMFAMRGCTVVCRPLGEGPEGTGWI